MGGFTRELVLAGLSLLGLSLWAESPAQVPKAKETPTEHKKSVDVFNPIDGECTVLRRKPAGTVAKKGEWVVELDASALQDALVQQKYRFKAAEEAHRAATIDREVAEIGVKEFVDGISKEDIEQADMEIAQATAVRLRAEELAKSGAAADKLALAEAQSGERKARAKKAILLKYTEAKDLKALQGEVFKARAEELAREGAWQRERLTGEKLRRAIDACKVVAPIDGTVGYLRPVEVEDTFQKGEVLFRIFPATAPNPASKPK